MAATLVRDLRANLSLGMSDDEFQRGMEGLKAKAPRDGDQVAGAFAKSFSRQLGQAFRTLPRAQITADSSDADIKVNTLRESLRELANKRIGIDIDAASAFGEMRALRDELEGLSEVGDIAVRADVTKALAALNTVEQQVEKLDGRTADINVDVDGATEAVAQVGRIGGSLSNLASIGPAKLGLVAEAFTLLPIAGAAAAEGIVGVLGSALAGIGLAASKGSATAQAALAHLREAAKAEAAQIGQPFEKVWVTIVQQAERELSVLGPVVQRSLADLAPDVQTFVQEAGSSLEELSPAIEGVQRAFSAVLKSLGPELPGIMQHLASGIESITSAVEDNPEVITRMANALATMVEWAGKLIGGLTRLNQYIHENAASFHVLANVILPGSTALYGMVDAMGSTETATTAVTKATQTTAAASDDLTGRLAVLSAAYGLTGANAADAAQQMVDSWSKAFTSMTSLSGVVDQVESTTKASAAAAQQQQAASERLAEVQRASAEKIKSAQQEVADAHARAADRVKQAETQLSDAHVRAADQVEQAQDRIKSSQESLAAAVEDAAQREADAAQRVEDARQAAADAAEQSARKIADAEQHVEDVRRSAAQAAEDSSRRVEQAVQRVADAEADAAESTLQAERRLQDSHAREAEALDDLTAARERAQERMDDLARSATSGALDEEGAQLAIDRARQRLVEITAAGGAADPLDVREADLSYRQAVARLAEIKQRNADLRQEIDDANQAGVEGSDEVVQAKGRVAEAQQAEQEAEAALAKQRIDAARQVADAEQALSDARGEAATRQEEAARQVAAAEQSLADAHREAARQQEDASRALASAEAELNAARVAGAKDVAKAQADVATAQKEAAKAAKDAATDVKDAEAAVAKAHQDAARDVAAAEEAMRQARKDTARDIKAANDDVKKSWTDLAGTAAVTTQQFLAELEKQVKDQQQWADNLVKLAGRVPPAMIDELVKMGPGGAQVVAMMTQMTEPELKKFVDLHAKSGKMAGDTFAENLSQAGPILQKIALQRGQEVADKVREGMDGGRTSVFEAARRIGIQVDVGIGPGRTIEIKLNAAPAYGQLNELLAKIGASQANVSVGVLQKSADGNIFMANGGVLSFAGGTENHTAQIAPAGTRVWAEPETAGEAYIPLADSKRSRSEQILAQVASTFGGMYLRPSGAAAVPSWTGGASAPSTRNVTYNVYLDGSKVTSPRDLADELYLMSLGKGY